MSKAQCCCDPPLGLHKVQRDCYMLNFHRIWRKKLGKCQLCIYVLVSVFKNGGLVYKNYRNRSFSNCIPKICAQNLHKSAQSVKKLSSASETLHKAICNKNIRIPQLQKEMGPSLPPELSYFWAD